jgi:hypothetical protein
VTLADGTTELHPLAVRALPAPELNPGAGTFENGTLVVETLQPEFVWTLDMEAAEHPRSVLVAVQSQNVLWSQTLPAAVEMRATFGVGGRTLGPLTPGQTYVLNLVVSDASGSFTQRSWPFRVQVP